MSRATDASLKRMAAADRGEWDEVERLEAEEAKAKPKKSHPKKKTKGLLIQIQEMEAFDGNPTMRYLIFTIEFCKRKPKEDYDNTWAPTGWTAEEMVGWCDMAQWRLAQRVGVTEDHMGRMLRTLEEKGFIEIEGWRDPDDGKLHSRYRVIPEMIAANQRKEHSRRAARNLRYAPGSRKANAGSFSHSNQPKITALQQAVREEDSE